MISDNIIVAIITGLFAFAGVVISNYATNKKMTIEQARQCVKDLRKILGKISVLYLNQKFGCIKKEESEGHE